MTKLDYAVNLTTELDETHPIAQRILALSEEDRTAFLRLAFTSLIADKKLLEEANEGNSWAVLKIA
jgi:phosphatidate phosphatase PAH1